MQTEHTLNAELQSQKLISRQATDQFEPELVAQEVDELLPVAMVLVSFSATLSILGSEDDNLPGSSGEAGTAVALRPSLVSKRSIKRETVAIPALTSLLTSEPRSATEELREKSLSFHPLVLLVTDSLYLMITITREASSEVSNYLDII